jgi:hypothetical protein
MNAMTTIAIAAKGKTALPSSPNSVTAIAPNIVATNPSARTSAAIANAATFAIRIVLIENPRIA